MSSQIPIVIDSLDDPRVEAYRNLKDRELSREGERFIAESEWVVRRLLASELAVESVLVAQRRAKEMAEIVPASVPLYCVADAMVHQIIGFKFHSGVIACGRRGASPSVAQIVPAAGKRSTVVICPDLISHENLGALARISSAFGLDGMILGPQCCDPFYRQSIRVSMGTVFTLPIVSSSDLGRDVCILKSEFGYEVVGTVLNEDAEVLESVDRGERLAIMFGNEAQGLSAEDVALCDRQVTIPMQRGVDSLNVSVAAGVILYHFTRGEKGNRRDAKSAEADAEKKSNEGE